MSRILRSLLESTTYGELRTLPMKMKSSSSLDYFPLLNTTANYYKRTTTAQPHVEMNFGTKLGYVLAFVFIFVVGILGLVGRIAYRGNETTTYLVYMKYHRENEMNTYNSHPNSNKMSS